MPDWLAAIDSFTPAAFYSTSGPTARQGQRGWADVGGLPEVRAALREVLQLPRLFPKLLASAPIRLRSGMLLYGPPGCGKTHVVACAVAEYGMRCITVKGPELVNKYIGDEAWGWLVFDPAILFRTVFQGFFLR